MAITNAGLVVCTLVFPVQGNSVLLGLGKKGYNKGLWNGYGGKVDPGDTSVRHTAVRELEEEVGIVARREDLSYHGVITFVWESEVPGLGVTTAREVAVHMYSVRTWNGVPQETEAMGVPTWFSVSELPLHRMPLDSGHWLPLVFNNESFVGTVRYASTREIVAYTIDRPEHLLEPQSSS